VDPIIYYTNGFAGTGKSTLLMEKASQVPIDSTVVIAPTHKAIKRIRDGLPQGMEIKTIDSLLGWIPAINEEATSVHHINTTVKLDKSIEEYTHIIIDEAGMMSEEAFMELISKIENLEPYDKEVEFHLYLDLFQLEPVKGSQIQTDPDTTTTLTKQYRSESPDVVALYTKFVHYLTGENHSDLTTPYSENILPFDISKFKKGDRLLAFTNEAVGNWNKIIANHFGITSYLNQEVQLGNRLDTVIVWQIVNNLSTTNLVHLFKSGQLILQDSRIKKQFLEYSLEAVNKMCDYYIVDFLGNHYPVIAGINNHYTKNKQLKQKAINDKKQFKHVYTLGRIWAMDYTYASTVHKSQGSEFDTVFIDREDIKKCIMSGYYDKYARMMYVSISRAKRRVYL
jgi:hypothetical protein